MGKVIHLSDSLVLPLEAITNTFAVFGIRGAGKSNIGAVMAEGIIKAGQPVCIIDPTGAWYGLKSSSDGKSPGLPVYVFGGEHADIPLEPTAGEVLANFMVERRVPVVLDLKLMRKHEQIKFMVAFAETLYHRNREPLMVFVDEAARFAPQIIKDRSPEAARCLGAMEDLATLGRTRGLGVTLMAQRPAPVSTTLRTQIENLICLRTIGKHDRTALDEWVEAKGTKEERDQMMKDLAELADGVGYFWSPGWLHKFVKVHFNRRETFDSGRTPKIGERVLAPRAFAEIDKGQLSAEIQATIERAKADDPRELRKKIADLEKQIKAAPSVTAPQSRDPEATKKAVDRAVDSIRKSFLREMQGYERKAVKILNDATAVISKAAGDVETARSWFIERGWPALPSLEGITVEEVPATRTFFLSEQHESRVPRKPMREAPLPASSSNGHGSIPVGERAILTACAQYRSGVPRKTLTILTAYKRSTRDAYIQRLGEKHLITVDGDKVFATASGIHALGSDFEPLPTGGELQSYWLDRLPEGEKRILAVLLEFGGQTVGRDHIEEQTGFKRSTRDAYIQRLKARQVVEVFSDGVAASKELF